MRPTLAPGLMSFFVPSEIKLQSADLQTASIMRTAPGESNQIVLDGGTQTFDNRSGQGIRSLRVASLVSLRVDVDVDMIKSNE
jgi:hypothetical protein